MSDTDQDWHSAWEPLTPRGVAAFAGASTGRLFLVQTIVAFLAAISIVWFLERGWFPIVRNSIQQLPPTGNISGGQLNWSGDSPVQLAGNRFLGVAIDLYHSGQIGREAHLQVEFGQEDFRVYSLLGYQVIEYPPDWIVDFNRTKLEPWWGAWEPMIAVGVAAGVFVALMISWAIFAAIYCVPVRVITLFENHDLRWAQSWRLAGAAMMPGALFLTAGIFAYGFGWMDLLQLGAIFGLHFVIGWIYLFVSPFFCPRHSATKVGANPFAAPKEKPVDAADPKPSEKNGG